MASKTIVCILEAENGFSRRLKLPAKNLPMKIEIPFMYKIRVSSPVIGDHFDLEISPVGVFQFERSTEKTAWYRLSNMYQAKALTS